MSRADNSTDESGFEIYRNAENDDKFNQIATLAGDKTAYEDCHLASDTISSYRLQALWRR